MESPAVGAGGSGKPEGDTVCSEAPPSPFVFVPASAGGCLGLTSCRNAATFSGLLGCPSPSLQTDRPDLGGAGGARWEPGAHCSQHTQPRAACPQLISRQSRPSGGRGQALHLANLRGHSQPEPQSSQAPMAGSPLPRPRPGVPAPPEAWHLPSRCSAQGAHPRPSQPPSHRAREVFAGLRAGPLWVWGGAASPPRPESRASAGSSAGSSNAGTGGEPGRGRGQMGGWGSFFMPTLALCALRAPPLV